MDFELISISYVLWNVICGYVSACISHIFSVCIRDLGHQFERWSARLPQIQSGLQYFVLCNEVSTIENVC